jgi:TatD DNase family protein
VITDTHAHLYWKSFDPDRAEVLARARRADVGRLIVPGTDLATSRAAFELCAAERGLYPAAGIHPHDAAHASSAVRAEIAELARTPECVAVGETGLDFCKEFSPRAAQIESFHWHLELARALDKPVIVHCRDAHEATARCIAAFRGVRGVMHCYTLGPAELEPYLEAGFYISFSGVLTFPKNDANRAAAARVPGERLLVETDCPYLAPQPERGKRNEPAHVIYVLAALAQVRAAPFAELAHATSENAARLFGLAPLGAPATAPAPPVP